MWKSRMPGRQHNDGKWSARCEGPERDWWGAEEVNGMQPTQKSHFIRSAGWEVDKTTRDVQSSQAVWRTNMHGFDIPPALTFSSRSVWWHDEYEKQKTSPQNDHNSTVTQILFSGWSEVTYCAKAELHVWALYWGGISSPLSSLNTSGFPLLICYAILGAYGSF